MATDLGGTDGSLRVDAVIEPHKALGEGFLLARVGCGLWAQLSKSVRHICLTHQLAFLVRIIVACYR